MMSHLRTSIIKFFRKTMSLISHFSILIPTFRVSFCMLLSNYCSFGSNYSSITDGVFEFDDGTSFPYTLIGHRKLEYIANTKVLYLHGLGMPNPRKRTHNNDLWMPLIRESCLETSTTFLSYTARGHGESAGWEKTADTNILQFSWQNLAKDASVILSGLQFEKAVISGSSMGAATSLYYAINNPDRVIGLILIRPPTAWESRIARRERLIVRSQRFLNDNVRYVILGAAYSDLPPMDESTHLTYGRIKCPVLILTIRGSPAHPISTARKLHKAINNSQLYIAENSETAKLEWPCIIKEFLQNI